MPATVPLESPVVASLMENSLKLLRHMNPIETENNLKLLGEALPQIKYSLKEVVDVPSKILVATEANNREFLTSELSKSIEGFYRCPWDDKMYSEDGNVVQEDATNKSLSPELKKLEKALNEAVSTYASLYYGSDSITSAYIENETENGDKFLISILIKKSAEVDDEENDFQAKAVWDSVHLFEITKKEDDFVYFHTATVMLSFDNSVEQVKNINLSGNLIRQNESKFSINKDSSKHLIHVGSLLEESESRLRNDLQSLYFGRTHDIVNELRSAMPEGYLRNQADFRDEMMAKLGKRNN